MGRARLRVKTGCLTCRKRRKGCDEQKPVCSACQRLQLPCLWPPPIPPQSLTTTAATVEARPTDQDGTAAVSNSSDQPISKTARRILPAPKLLEPQPGHALSNGYPRFRNDTEYWLFGRTATILRMFICPIADASCRKLDRYMCASLQEPWTRDATVAFTASFIALAEPMLAVRAASLYQSALKGVRDNLYDHATVRRRQMLLVATNCLGLIETLCQGDEEKSMIHFTAVGQYLSLEARNGPAGDPESQSLYRFAAECVIFNVASLAAFCRDLDRLGRIIDWDALEGYFQQDPRSMDSSYHNSPFLGGRRDIYRVMFATSWLAQSDPSKLNAGVDCYLSILQYEVFRLQDTLATYYHTDVAAPVNTLYTIKYQLHLLALQIYLLKIGRPGICSANRNIADLVSQSLSLLLTGKLDEEYNPSLCWPLTILLCAVHDEADFQSLERRIAVYQKMLGAGHATRMQKIVSRLKQRRASASTPCLAEIDAGMDCNHDHDGLNLLLQRGGLT